MSPKKKLKKGSGSVSSASTASQDDIDDISIALATVAVQDGHHGEDHGGGDEAE